MYRVIITLDKSPAFNMACDEALLILRKNNKTEPVFRLYNWNPFTVSIGYSQDIEKAVSLRKIQEKGYGYVRRWTGGRAVLHNDEITYSVIGKAEEDNLMHTVLDTYNKISSGLNKGLNLIGVKSSLSKNNEASNIAKDKRLIYPCFGSTSKYEIEYEGRKLIGSAQRRVKDLVLQHGSILMNGPKTELSEVMPLDSEEKIERYKRILEKNTITISEIMGREYKLTDLAEYFIKGMESVFFDDFVVSELSNAELKLINEVAEKKYSTDLWNLERRTDYKGIET